MNIYIARDFDGNPMHVILADNKEKAEIAFMGMNAQHHSTEEINPNDKTLGLHGVAFLLTSHTIKVRDERSGDFRQKELRIFKRGL